MPHGSTGDVKNNDDDDDDEEEDDDDGDGDDDSDQPVHETVNQVKSLKRHPGRPVDS